ncbi:MAG: putative Ig domain-containing protein [Chitinispirillales bacterium]|jgi:hypothetical protein|nr:putative Ig domain-containing protein [Chitinispirillales bacterium]
MSFSRDHKNAGRMPRSSQAETRAIRAAGCRPYRIALLLAVTLFLYHSAGYAKVINAADGTTAGIQAAVYQAAAGDTVRIPAGTFNYSGSVSMNGGITILGAGKNSTVLNKTGSSTTAMFVVNGNNGRRVTIGQLTLSGITGSSSTMQDNGIRLNSCTDFHVFDVAFKNFGYSAVYVTGNSRGVLRKCDFLNIFRQAINNLGYGVVIYGDRDGSWSRPLQLGTADAIYIEDCYFSNNRHAVASNDGSKYVFRYNTVVDNAGNFQSVDAHGREYGSPRGSRSFEVYNNTIDNSVRNAWCSIMIRGGDGVVFNNNLLRGTSSAPILLCNRTDGSHSSTSYPAPDQTRSLYVWNNKLSNGNIVGVTVRGGHESFFRLGRDYFHQEMPGYKPYTYPHPLSGPQAPAITNDNLPEGQISTNYSHTLSASGGTAPYNWSVTSGTLPSGLSMSGSGVISGIPVKAQSADFTVKVTDANGGQTTKELSISIINPDEVNLINESTLYRECGWFAAGNPLSSLWDGNVSGNPQSSMPGSSAADSIWIEFDFKDIHRLSRIRLFGDTDGSWVSKTFSVFVKANESDPWIQVVNNKECFGNRWYESETSADARYLRLAVKGDQSKNSVQIRALEVYGELDPQSSGSTSVIKKPQVNLAKPGILSHSQGLLRYNVPQTARVRLTVHDLRGRRVNPVFDKVQTAGIHELQINSLVNNSGKMAAGQYVYRLSIGEETFTISAPHLRK